MRIVKIVMTVAAALVAAVIMVPASANAAGTGYIRGYSANSQNCPVGHVCLSA